MEDVSIGIPDLVKSLLQKGYPSFCRIESDGRMSEKAAIKESLITYLSKKGRKNGSAFQLIFKLPVRPAQHGKREVRISAIYRSPGQILLKTWRHISNEGTRSMEVSIKDPSLLPLANSKVVNPHRPGRRMRTMIIKENIGRRL